MTRLSAMFVVFTVLGCHSADWRGPSPAHPPAIGHKGSRAAELPPAGNTPFNYGWGSGYDPHPTGSKATMGRPSETGSLPPFWSLQNPGRPMGVPPPEEDEKKKK